MMFEPKDAQLRVKRSVPKPGYDFLNPCSVIGRYFPFVYTYYCAWASTVLLVTNSHTDIGALGSTFRIQPEVAKINTNGYQKL